MATVSTRSPHRLRLLLRILTVAGAVLLLLLLAAGAWLRFQLGRSLPQLDGEQRLPGLSSQVTVERDALGVPLVTGATRVDVGRALGFVHAQERFFQMDLRAPPRVRVSSPNCSGPWRCPPIGPADSTGSARERVSIVDAASAEDRALLDAYAAGVNAGLGALRASPLEYLLLRVTPLPWRAEDCVLVVASMFFNLQDATACARRGRPCSTMCFPRRWRSSCSPPRVTGTRPSRASRSRRRAVPGADVFDLRGAALPRAAERRRRPSAARGDPTTTPTRLPHCSASTWTARHSCGAATTGPSRGAVPRTAARFSPTTCTSASSSRTSGFVPRSPGRAATGTASRHRRHAARGAAVTVGSNGSVAWGFTNTTADWTDRVVLDGSPGDPSRYRTPDGAAALRRHPERIRVKGEETMCCRCARPSGAPWTSRTTAGACSRFDGSPTPLKRSTCA